MSQVFRTFLQTFATKGAGFVATLLGGIALSRTLGPHGKGQVDVTVMLAALLLLLAFPSLEDPQLRHLGRRIRPPATLLANGLVVALFFGAVVWGLFEFLAHDFPEIFAGRDREGNRQPADLDALRILVVAATLAIGHRMVAGWLQGLGDMKSFNLAFLSQNLTLLLGFLGLVVVAGGGPRAAIWSHAAAHLAGFSCALFFALRRPELREGPFRIAPRALLALIGDGLRLHGGAIAAFVILESDKLVLFRYRGFEVVGLYAIAVALTGHLRRLMLVPVKEVLGSQLPRLTNDEPALAAAVARATRSTLPLIALPGLLLMAGGWLAIWILYGTAFTPAWAPLLVLVPGSVFWALAVVAGYWFLGTGRFFHLTVVGLGIASTNVGLNLLFVPAYGMMAAAATSTFCYGLHIAAFTFLISRQSGLSPRALLVPRRADFALLAGVLKKVPVFGRRLAAFVSDSGEPPRPSG